MDGPFGFRTMAGRFGPWRWRRRGRVVARTGLAARLLAGEERALRAVLEASASALALLDTPAPAPDAPPPRLLAWNEALTALAGPTLPLRAGMPVTELAAPDGRAALTALLAEAASDGGGCARRPDPVEIRLADAGGTSVELRAVSLPEDGEDDEDRPGALLLLRLDDLTSRRRMEEQLASAGRLQAVGQLAGGIAHDFNNLLTAISGGVEAILVRASAPAGPAPDAEMVTELRHIQDAAARGTALVRQLLAFARQQALNPRVLVLNQAVEDVSGLLRRLLGAPVRLELELSEPGRQVRVDPAQLDQVVVNLAVNARDAMPDGGTLRIATSDALVLRPEPAGPETIPPGRYVLLEISDTGMGIPPEVLPRIFEPFFTTRRERGGTGLGLATVHGIVRQSGGYIAVRSTPGAGTTFRIWLPRHDGPAESALPRAAPPPAAPSPPPSPGVTVLLVEDEAPLRRLAERALTRAGFTVVAAEGAEEALERLAEMSAAPAVLVSDVAMPGMDGLALARRVRERVPDLPVLLVSGYAEAVLEQDLAAEGMRLLSKPYSLAELVAQVTAVMQPKGERGRGFGKG